MLLPQVVEDCPLVAMGAGPSTDRLLQAEQAVTLVGQRVCVCV